MSPAVGKEKNRSSVTVVRPTRAVQVVVHRLCTMGGRTEPV
ncbi:hypothetical protein SGL43_03903 [Streptomyces globisporus]|uniref:Uncharacterized protein n=1 Tax=Streptomyces globisporus TaxID=1908 RepID=A0ABM9GZW4_STRGL|nr:hypothetical protein SGL43_03903 [Streptomyces globisporus]